MSIERIWKEIVRKVSQNKTFRRIYKFFNKLVLPGFQGVPFLEVMRFFIESLFKGILFQRAAAMTYRLFISIIPLLMALFAAISFLDESLRLQLLDLIQSMVPDYTWPAISGIISGVIMKQNGALLYSSFGIGLYLTLLSLNSIVATLNITYFKIQTRNLFQQLLVSLILLVVMGVIIILGIGIFIGASYAINYINSNIEVPPAIYSFSIASLKWILLAVLAYICISSLFYVAPVNKKNFKFFSAGSTFSTVMLIILLYALNFYFYYFPTYNLIYGSIGALFAILLWIYWSSTIILIGFDLNVSIFVAKQKMKENGNIVLESTLTDTTL